MSKFCSKLGATEILVGAILETQKGQGTFSLEFQLFGLTKSFVLRNIVKWNEYSRIMFMFFLATLILKHKNVLKANISATSDKDN